MNSKDLNKKIQELCHSPNDRSDLIPDEIKESGKPIFYWGWVWRTVDFDSRITFASEYGLKGFCENNKWDYPEFDLTDEESAKVKELCIQLVTNPNKENATILFDYMQSIPE